MKKIYSSLNKNQIDSINVELHNFPKKLNAKDRVKRILVDLIGLVFLVWFLYRNNGFSSEFFILVFIVTLMIFFAIYCHTNEAQNNKMELFVARERLKKRTKYKIVLAEDRVSISNANNYDNFFKVLNWNELIVCVVGNSAKLKRLVFIDLNDEEKKEFLSKIEKIYNLSLETVDKKKRLNDYLGE